MASQIDQELVVLDPELKVIGSHHFQYDHSIVQGAHSLGIKVQVFGHHDGDPEIVRKLSVVPVFSDLLGVQRRIGRAWPLRALPQLAGLLLYLAENHWRQRELERIFRPLSQKAYLVLVPTCGANLLVGLTRVLAKRVDDRTRAVLVFHQPPSRVTSRMAVRALLPLIRAGRFKLAATNEALAALYQEIVRSPVAVVPWPLPPPLLPASCRLRSASKQPVQFLMIGGFRMEKGIGLLVRALEILEDRIADQTLRFLIQGYPNPDVANPEAEQQFQAVKAFAARQPGVRLIDLAFDPAEAEYRNLYAESDVVLLPYSRQPYRLRDSAVMMEALALGKPTITTEGTTMATLMQRSGAGLTCVDGSAPDLARVILEIAENIPRFAAEAERRREVWSAYHNPENYLRVIGDLAAGTMPPVAAAGKFLL